MGPMNCIVCQESFELKAENQIYCGMDCRKSATNEARRNRRRLTQKSRIECQKCGEEVARNSSNQKFCSPDCYEAGIRDRRNALYRSRYARNPEVIRERGNQSSSLRRRLAECVVEAFSRADVWVKGGGECIYCERELDEGLWDMDHFVPISLGGSHTLANCVAACRGCNRRKRNKMPEVFIASERLRKRL